MKRRLVDPYLLGLQGIETAHPWWLTGGLPSSALPHTQPAGSDGGAGGDGGGSGGTGSTDGEPTGGADGGGTGEPSTETVSKAEFDRVQEHLRQADRKREEAEKRLKEIDDKDKSELERTTARVEELEKEKEKQDRELADLRLQNAFLTVNAITWHNPGAALTLARQEGYLEGVVSEDGKVDQAKLKTKLEQFAGKNDYLVKKDGATPPPPPPPSGSGVGSGGRQRDNGTPEEAALKARYRVLNR